MYLRASLLCVLIYAAKALSRDSLRHKLLIDHYQARYNDMWGWSAHRLLKATVKSIWSEHRCEFNHNIYDSLRFFEMQKFFEDLQSLILITSIDKSRTSYGYDESIEKIRLEFQKNEINIFLVFSSALLLMRKLFPFYSDEILQVINDSVLWNNKLINRQSVGRLEILIFLLLLKKIHIFNVQSFLYDFEKVFPFEKTKLYR